MMQCCFIDNTSGEAELAMFREFFALTIAYSAFLDLKLATYMVSKIAQF